MAGQGKKRGMTMQTRVMLVCTLLSSVVFLPTAIIVFIGMLPSLVAIFIDRTAEKTRGLTVAAMNFAGCMPFALQLWTKENTADHAITMISDPRTIIVMYCAAGVGYVVDWAVSGLVGSIMVQTGTARLQHIKARQAELIERWGREVSGEIPTDRQGFPVDLGPDNDGKPQTAKKSR